MFGWIIVFIQAIEGDCDVVLKKVNGALTVTAFKCKTEGKTFSTMSTHTHTESNALCVSLFTKNMHVSFFVASTEDLCVGCPSLLPLNDTNALNFVQASLATFNNNTVNTAYAILEVGRMSSQVGPNTVYNI